MKVSEQWEMRCPNPDCPDPDGELDVEAKVWVRLTSDGTDADESQNGDHEWDEKSKATCAACNWSGTVGELEKAFEKMGIVSEEDEDDD